MKIEIELYPHTVEFFKKQWTDDFKEDYPDFAEFVEFWLNMYAEPANNSPRPDDDAPI